MHKGQGCVPSFKHLLIFYAQDLAGIPQEPVKQVAAQGISLGFPEARDHAHMDSLNMEWLEGEEEHKGGKTDEDDVEAIDD